MSDSKDNGNVETQQTSSKYAEIDALLDKLDPAHPVVAARAETMVYDLIIRKAKTFAASDIVPKGGKDGGGYRGNVANCSIALEMAQRLKIEPLIVMQNLYIVHGMPSWKSSFLIGLINASGLFKSNLNFEITGTGEEKQCVAWATRKDGQRVEGPPVSMGMARKEEWISRKGSKWQTMPEVMLRYRSAAFFARLAAPELGLGLYTVEEAQDTAANDAPAVQANGVAERLKAKAVAVSKKKTAPAEKTPAPKEPSASKPQSDADLEREAFIAEQSERSFSELRSLYLALKAEAKGFDIAKASRDHGLGENVCSFGMLKENNTKQIAGVLYDMKRCADAA